MRLNIFSPAFVILVILLLPGCLVKTTLKKGSEYESAGMFRDAADLYYNACLKKPDKPELKIALKRSGQLYLEEQAGNIAQSYNRGEYRNTVYDYLAVTEFVEKLRQISIDLKPDPALKIYFDDAKENYLSDRYEDGQKLLGEQKYNDARSVFSEIYDIDPGFKDTRNYLSTATNEPVYQDGSRLFGEAKYMDAYEKWNSIYIRERNYKDVADRMQQALNERYKEGTLLLMQENFHDASTALGEVYRIDPAFKDVKTLYTEARNEPVYRRANIFLKNGKCRTAYYAFDDVVKDAGIYKDATELREKSLACAQYPIAVKTMAQGSKTSEAQQFQSLLINQLISQKNPFLKVYDLAIIDKTIDQNIVNRSGNIDQNQLRQLTGKQNIKALLFLDFSELSRVDGKLKKSEKTGFERTITKLPDGQTSVSDKQVKYEETSKENSVTITLSYKLIDTGSGEILLSDKLSDNKIDDMKYASYTGATANLYPSVYQNGSNRIDENNYRNLQSLLHSSKTITPVEKLTDHLFESLSQKIAGNINNFNPEK